MSKTFSFNVFFLSGIDSYKLKPPREVKIQQSDIKSKDSAKLVDSEADTFYDSDEAVKLEDEAAKLADSEAAKLVDPETVKHGDSKAGQVSDVDAVKSGDVEALKSGETEKGETLDTKKSVQSADRLNSSKVALPDTPVRTFENPNSGRGA